LFRELQAGQTFAHAESVMAVLVAMRHAGVEWFANINNAFASSRIAEIAHVRRLAQRLAR
jgi:hypothetical protein